MPVAIRALTRIQDQDDFQGSLTNGYYLKYNSAAGKFELAQVAADPSFATPAIVLGTAAADGAASTAIRSDSTIVAFDATAPSTQAYGDSAATGSAAVAARRDHKHAMPAAMAGYGSFASKPAAGVAGRLWIPSDGYNQWVDDGAAWRPFVNGMVGKAPVDGDFAWVNQGGASIASTSGALVLTAPTVSGVNVRVRAKTAPSTPYTLTVALSVLALSAGGNGGIGWRQSSDGKLVLVEFGYDAGLGFWTHVGINKYTSATGTVTGYTNPVFNWTDVIWIRIADNGTNRIISFGLDKDNFSAAHTIGRTDFLTADQIVFFANNGNQTASTIVKILSWEEA